MATRRRKELMSGNEAFARGAWEAGATVGAGYPGTPSTEILEHAVSYKPDIYCEWSPNEKVAFEVAVGASLAGARAFCTMKHVGLNVAADPLMTFSYVGAVGGFVVVVADDPGMHSSQNEQDSRHYARFAKAPLLEPSDAQEAKDFLVAAFGISERFRTPVIVRSTTRVSHARSLVELGERQPREFPGFHKDPPRFVPVPAWGRKMRLRVEERLHELMAEAGKTALNRLEAGSSDFGVITAGISYQYVKEIFPEASVLKLGLVHPISDSHIRDFAGRVKRLLVVEELDDFIESHVRALGIDCEGRNLVPGVGELSPERLKTVRGRIEGLDETFILAPVSADLPPRPPVLCPGCPHRGVFVTLGRFSDVVVAGDIGCYSLGAMSPLDRMDAILCMGGGITLAHGMARAGEKKKMVGMVGDSTFFHSGMTGLLNLAYNRSDVVICVVDNRTTAMTGHQDHPGTGRTLMGEPAREVSIEDVAAACGIERRRVVDPYDIAETAGAFREEMETPGPSLIVSRAPCALRLREPLGGPLSVDSGKCTACRACLRSGCPALEAPEGKPMINPSICAGCGICGQLCRFGAIGASHA